MQSALWAVSDNNDLIGISHPELMKFVATLLNKPIPDYTVNYNYTDEAGATAATALEPLAIATSSAVAMVAARVRGTRLIDNLVLGE